MILAFIVATKIAAAQESLCIKVNFMLCSIMQLRNLVGDRGIKVQLFSSDKNL